MANNKIQTAVQQTKPEARAQQSVSVMLNSLLDGEKMRKRFDELLGARTPQFLSSLVSMINDQPALQQAFYQSPMSVIKSALQAATYDLPIDPTLGYAYIVPYNNNVKDANGNWVKKMTATFVLGYKGMVQLCLRTGAYSRIPDATDVRQGELIRYDRLTGDAEFAWIEDEDEREQLPIIGYAGYLRLKNGAEKTLYMSKAQIDAHERKNRKGRDMGKGWREDYDAMAKKTVLRRLISHYGLMSIDYRNADAASMALATALAQGETQDTPDVQIVDSDASEHEQSEDEYQDTPEVISALPEKEQLEFPDFLKEGDKDAVYA